MNYLLKSPPNRNGEALIYLAKNYHRKRFKLSTDLTIHPDQWDPKRSRPKRGYKYYSQYCALLDRIEEAVTEAYLELKLTCIPNTAQLKELALSKLNRAEPLTVAQYAAQYAESKRGVSLGTIRQFRLVAGWLDKFDKRLTFDKIDLGVMLEFRDYLLDQKLAANTVQGLFKRFKTILNAATEEGVNVNLKYRNRKAKATGAETTAIFLNEEELERIRLAPIPEQLEKYRDVLLVLCYTGVRFLDAWSINESSFVEGGRYFRITDRKENALAQIPAHPVVMAIMKRYDWKLPRIANPVFNRYIKEVGQLAKIDQEITVTKFPGGVRVNTLVPKYKLIMSHTGRRSLITNLIIAGMNREVIKSISGHKSDSAFNRYIRLAPADSLSIAHKSSFYKGKLKIAK